MRSDTPGRKALANAQRDGINSIEDGNQAMAGAIVSGDATTTIQIIDIASLAARLALGHFSA